MFLGCDRFFANTFENMLCSFLSLIVICGGNAHGGLVQNIRKILDITAKTNKFLSCITLTFCYIVLIEYFYGIIFCSKSNLDIHWSGHLGTIFIENQFLNF